MNDDQKAHAFAPAFGDECTGFHCHMISAVVIFYLNTLQSMLFYYAVTDMGCFDDYSDAAPRTKTMNGDGITTFILHFDQCITFNQNPLEFIIFNVLRMSLQIGRASCRDIRNVHYGCPYRSESVV